MKLGWIDNEMMRHRRPDEEYQQRGNQEVGGTRPEHPDFLGHKYQT